MTQRNIPVTVSAVERGDALYPEKMKQLTSMPQTLYYAGSLPDGGAPSVAIVGARLCSPYGRDTAYEFGRILAREGVQIISGMAAGIDGYAQTGALDAGGRSFAVLGSGVDICYPRSNGTLYRRLLKEGGILSEQPPGTKPYPYHFPSRNRIISALADLVLIVEAKSRSGSLITVDFALSQGRTVFAVPGRVGDLLSDGCNYLIAQGAGIAWSPDAILQELKIMEDRGLFPKKQRLREKRERRHLMDTFARDDVSDDAKKVLACLSDAAPCSADALAETSALPVPRLLAALDELCELHLAEEQTKGRFIRSGPGPLS